MGTFDRSQSTLESSLALWRYRRDRGDLSHYYWTGLAASDLFAFTLKSHAEDEEPMTALGVQDPKYVNRLGHSIGELKRRVKTEARWRRLSSLVLSASAFERFLFGIGTAAVDSDPTLTPGFPKKIDGLVLKKHDLAVSRPDLESLIKGEWSSRISAYRTLFGSVPQEILDVEGELEQLRAMRNQIAHQFAFNDASLENHMRLVLGGRRVAALESNKINVGHERLIKWLTMLGRVSDAIDTHLNSNFIGGYETGAIYLDWQRRPDSFEKAAGIVLPGHKKSASDRRFGSVLSAVLDKPLGGDYPRSVIAYIAAI